MSILYRELFLKFIKKKNKTPSASGTESKQSKVGLAQSSFLPCRMPGDAAGGERTLEGKPSGDDLHSQTVAHVMQENNMCATCVPSSFDQRINKKSRVSKS